MTEEVVQAELEAQRRLLDVEHQRKMAGIREEMENEVIKDWYMLNWGPKNNFFPRFLIFGCTQL